MTDLAPDVAPEEGRPNGASPPPQEAQQKSAKEAVLADSFCVLAKLVAWHKPRQQACEKTRESALSTFTTLVILQPLTDGAVIETTAKSVAPVSHCYSSSLSDQLDENASTSFGRTVGWAVCACAHSLSAPPLLAIYGNIRMVARIPNI